MTDNETLTITDNRTQRSYTIPIYRGTVRAMDLRQIKTSGIISPNKWGNLPGGETFTTPERVDGRFVIDGVVGDYLCEKYGDLHGTPLTIEVVESRLREAHCANQELEAEFWRYCHTDENSDRVGEFAHAVAEIGRAHV